MLAQKVKEYGWNFDAKSKKYYAPEDVRYTVDANEEKRNPADIMRELTAVNRVYTLAQEYENNSSLRGMIDALRQGLPLTGNETDLRNATDEKKTQELMFYANAIDQVSGFQAENIQYMSDELAALDTIYALPQGPHREAAIQGLGKYKYTPANALQHAIDQTLYDNLSPQFVKSHEKQFKAKNPQGEQEIIASVKTSLVE